MKRKKSGNGYTLPFIVAFIALVLFFAIGNAVSIEVGDYVVAKENIDLRNYDDITTSVAYKPVTCHAVKGEIFEVTSSGNLLGLKDSDNGCWGGAEKEYFKKLDN